MSMSEICQILMIIGAIFCCVCVLGLLISEAEKSIFWGLAIICAVGVILLAYTALEMGPEIYQNVSSFLGKGV